MTKNIKTSITAFVACSTLWSFTDTAQAVTILNAGFEAPGGGGFPQATSWTGEARLAPHSGFGPGSFSPGNAFFAFSNPGRGPVTQTLADSFLPNTTYVFQGYGVQSTTPDTDLRFLIGYDDGSGFVELGSETYDLNPSGGTPITDWTLLDGVSYSTGSTGTEVGANIVVQIEAVGAGNQGGWFDQVTLTATPVPEPGSLVLLTLGSVLVARRRRRA